MKLTIIFRDESREVECVDAQVRDGLLYVTTQEMRENFRASKDFEEPFMCPYGEPVVSQIWNMNNIIGVEMDNG